MQALPAAEAAAILSGWSLRAGLAYRFAASYFAIFFMPAFLFRPLDSLIPATLQ